MQIVIDQMGGGSLVQLLCRQNVDAEGESRQEDDGIPASIIDRGGGGDGGGVLLINFSTGSACRIDFPFGRFDTFSLFCFLLLFLPF